MISDEALLYLSIASLVVVFALSLWLKLTQAKRAGKYGEANIKLRLKGLPKDKYTVFDDDARISICKLRNRQISMKEAANSREFRLFLQVTSHRPLLIVALG